MTYTKVPSRGNLKNRYWIPQDSYHFEGLYWTLYLSGLYILIYSICTAIYELGITFILTLQVKNSKAQSAERYALGFGGILYFPVLPSMNMSSMKMIGP